MLCASLLLERPGAAVLSSVHVFMYTLYICVKLHWESEGRIAASAAKCCLALGVSLSVLDSHPPLQRGDYSEHSVPG